MRYAALGFACAACAGPPPPASPPAPSPPVTTGSAPVVPAAEPFTLAAVKEAIYAPLFDAGREFKLVGNRHLVTVGDAAGSLHYKVIVRCRVAEVAHSARGVAARVECANYPEDSLAINPLDRVWVAGASGLFRAEALPSSDAEWRATLAGLPVIPLIPVPSERRGECLERVSDLGDRWCWSETCPGEPALEGKLCFSREGALLTVEANSMAEASDVLALTVATEMADTSPRRTTPEATSPPPADGPGDDVP